jgi:hypothetical protein
MKAFLAGLFALSLFAQVFTPARAAEQVDKNLTDQISAILRESGKITPGTTRAELLKVFTTEGGLSTATHRTFVHRRCPYIKVDVEFTLSSPKQGGLDERPNDAVKTISKPYLAWSIDD